jgi:GNAT superfamily N-acetyltransferase
MCALSLHPATAADEATVLSIFLRSAAYFLHVEGAAPNMEIVRAEMSGAPKKKSSAWRKEFLLIREGDAPIGVVDLHVDHPQSGIGYIGLFLLAEDRHGQGIGTSAFQMLEVRCRAAHGLSSLRLGVSDDHDMSGFWTKLGFAPNGHSYEFQGLYRMTRSVEYEKKIEEVR